MFAEFASLHEPMSHRLHEYGAAGARELLIASQFVHAHDYLKALRARHLVQRDFEQIFQQADALITPGAPAAAPGRDMSFTINGQAHAWSNVVGRMTLIMSVVGVPALSIPTGFTRTGLPLGIQVVAPV